MQFKIDATPVQPTTHNLLSTRQSIHLKTQQQLSFQQQQDVPPISKNIAETEIDTLTEQYQTFAHVLTSFDLPPLQAK